MGKDFDFVEIMPGEVCLGKDNGGLFFAAERPRHCFEIKYQFAITKNCISEKEWNDVFKNKKLIPNYNKFTQKDIEEFIEIINNKNEDFKFRLPSESEWELAKKKLEINSIMPHNDGELIADQPHVSYWGAPCNGNPWLETNPKSAGYGTQLSKIPSLISKNAKRGVSHHKLHKNNIKFRLVKIPKERINSTNKILPSDFDRVEIFKREIIISIFIGIIPSFIWAYFNATPGYISRAFGNLILGGIFFSLITGLIYRPKHSTLKVLENKIISISPYRKKIKTLISFEDESP